MALDGIFLRHVKQELSSYLINSKIDKVYQPSKEELVLQLRTKEKPYKLLLSAKANSPRVHITNYDLENPKVPPMFCMLLRKKLYSAKLLNIRQKDLERVLYFDFESVNEFKDKVKLTIAVEIMGKHSNIILIDDNGLIIDAIKRVSSEMSSKRLILPGVKYKLPPAQNKICILNTSFDEIVFSIKKVKKNMLLEKAIINVIQGISPIVCREISYKVSITELNEEQEWDKFLIYLKELIETTKNITGQPYVLLKKDSTPIDYSFINIEQYGNFANTVKCNSFSELLDDFYYKRANAERMKAKYHNVLKLINNNIERIDKKINLQKQELIDCEKRNEFKINADLINANLYKLKKGQNYAELENFYNKDFLLKKIKLDPYLTPSQNAQKYYKKYNKLKNAEQELNFQIKKAYEEKNYLESVLDELLRTTSEAEIEEVKKELKEQKYIHEKKSKRIKERTLPPLKFLSSDGFTILVGRNNKQNDDLTLKKASKTDMWFHVKDIPGSHAILVLNKQAPTNIAIKEAAQIAAFNSKAKFSSSVPVDYTYIKYVHKPNNSKPGKVIYTNQKTIFVIPQQNGGLVTN